MKTGPSERNRNTIYIPPMRFDMICLANGIEQVEQTLSSLDKRMNRTVKYATINRFHYNVHDQLRPHLVDVMAANNFAKA